MASAARLRCFKVPLAFLSPDSVELLTLLTGCIVKATHLGVGIVPTASLASTVCNLVVVPAHVIIHFHSGSLKALILTGLSLAFCVGYNKARVPIQRDTGWVARMLLELSHKLV